jgi:uncharacterized membrane protein YeaQ/YmgE (transglycosylase-associated protein family)
VWLIVGAVVGWLADMVMKAQYGLLGDIIVGIIGAFVGGFLFNLIGSTTGNWWSVAVSVVVAVVLLALVRLFTGRPERTTG